MYRSTFNLHQYFAVPASHSTVSSQNAVCPDFPSGFKWGGQIEQILRLQFSKYLYPTTNFSLGTCSIYQKKNSAKVGFIPISFAYSLIYLVSLFTKTEPSLNPGHKSNPEVRKRGKTESSNNNPWPIQVGLYCTCTIWLGLENETRACPLRYVLISLDIAILLCSLPTRPNQKFSRPI